MTARQYADCGYRAVEVLIRRYFPVAVDNAQKPAVIVEIQALDGRIAVYVNAVVLEKHFYRRFVADAHQPSFALDLGYPALDRVAKLVMDGRLGVVRRIAADGLIGLAARPEAFRHEQYRRDERDYKYVE